MAFETNLIRGTQTHYGPRTTDLKFGALISSRGQEKSASWVFDFDDLPTASTTDEKVFLIPAGAIILDAYLYVITTFATGTAYDIDIVETDATAQGTGEDKLWDLLTLAELDASLVSAAMKSSTHGGTNSGNLIGQQLATAGQLQVVDNSTDFTAGRARIIVNYLTVPAA
jgi:hypothetical protein